MVCIDFSNDWFSFFPNKILGKILFSKEKVCNFLAKFLQNAFCISLSLFFFSTALVFFAKRGLLTAVCGLLLLWSMDSGAHGLSSYGTLASSAGAHGLSHPT